VPLPQHGGDEDSPLARRGPVLVFIGLAVLAVLWSLRSGTPHAAKPTAGERVIAFGDSLVEGVGASTGRDVVSLLSARVGVPIVNAGRSGDTTGTALARLDSAVLSRRPRVVIVVLGGNDFLRRVPHEETFANLDAIVDRIRERGAAVILVGLSFGVLTDTYGDRYEDLARRTSSGLVPDILAGILGQPDLMADHIHPNDRGYRMMADRIEPALRELLK
jgi:lysophospholipase L1-like esterase